MAKSFMERVAEELIRSGYREKVRDRIDDEIMAEMAGAVRAPVLGPVRVDGSLILRPGERFLVILPGEKG